MDHQKIRDIRIQQFNDLTSLQNYLIELGEISIKPSHNFIPKNTNNNTNTYDFQKISFRQENVIETMSQIENVGVLIFASAKNPGGGVLNGSIAQEEAISYHTTWYSNAKLNSQFYLEKGASALNTDNVSIANGFLLTDINHNELSSPKPIFFIACAAPNKTGIISQGLKINDETIYHHLELRICKILQAAEENNVENLILGAFGCGVFGLDSKIVASLFKKNISSGIFSGQIIFSIMDKNVLNEFETIILCENKHISKKSNNKIKN